MRVVFLDFDGVLNSAAYFDRLRRAERLVQLIEHDDHIDRAAVALLDYLVFATDAKIVISSSWRISRTLPELEETLTRAGLRAGRVIDKTVDLRGVPRGNEIQLWVDTHRPTSFVILDDDSDMGQVASRLVKTHFQEGGLRPEHVQRAIDLLTA